MTLSFRALESLFPPCCRNFFAFRPKPCSRSSWMLSHLQFGPSLAWRGGCPSCAGSSWSWSFHGWIWGWSGSDFQRTCLSFRPSLPCDCDLFFRNRNQIDHKREGYCRMFACRELVCTEPSIHQRSQKCTCHARLHCWRKQPALSEFHTNRCLVVIFKWRMNLNGNSS